jgi:hypothetical protein
MISTAERSEIKKNEAIASFLGVMGVPMAMLVLAGTACIIYVAFF